MRVHTECVIQECKEAVMRLRKEQEQEREEQGGAEHALRAELEPLRFSALVRRAKEEGVETADLDDAQEGDSPKQAIIELIVALKMSITEDL